MFRVATLAPWARAIDGDTLACGDERIRLSGIDAPEMKGKCREERQAAKRARDRLAELIRDDLLIRREGKDRYGRSLATVYAGGTDLGALLVYEGLARPWEGRRRPWCG